MNPNIQYFKFVETDLNQEKLFGLNDRLLGTAFSRVRTTVGSFRYDAAHRVDRFVYRLPENFKLS